MTTPALQSLVRTQLSDTLVDELIEEEGLPSDSAWLPVLRAEVRSRKDFTTLKKAIAEIAPMISESSREALEEELQEIQEDLEWVGSARGRYVIAINEWIQPFHQEFHAIERFARVLVGGHAEREVVFATGSVETREDYQALLEYLASKNPPFKIHTKVTIQSEAA